MYGLINKALKTMIVDNFGDDSWQKILVKSKVSEDAFVSMQKYDDSITYALVGATSETLGKSPEYCLEAFGHYWVTVTAPGAYNMLLESTGTDFISFLENVNNLHDRITSTFVGYIPPYFEIVDDAEEVVLKYESKREGLTPFVLGILKGLAERFDNQISFGEMEKCAVSSGETSLIRFRISDA